MTSAFFLWENVRHVGAIYTHFSLYSYCPSFHIVFVIEIGKASVSQTSADQIISASGELVHLDLHLKHRVPRIGLSRLLAAPSNQVSRIHRRPILPGDWPRVLSPTLLLLSLRRYKVP